MAHSELYHNESTHFSATSGLLFFCLCHLQVTWKNMYDNDPLTGITDPAAQARVLGGQTCMWGELVAQHNDAVVGAQPTGSV